MSPGLSRAGLFEAWRERRDGFAPLFLEPIMAPALAHLSLALRPGALVLDLGSGSGHVASAVRDCGGRTVCLEIDSRVLEESRRRYPGGTHLAGNAARLPIASASVDAIFCFSVLQYTERESALEEMRRVLKPEGRVVVVENLAGNLTALAYRAWRTLAGVRYARRLTPRRHASWRSRRRYLEWFPKARIDAFYLVSPVLLLFPAVYAADGSAAAGSPVRAALGACRAVDSFLMRRLPWSRHGAWMLLVRG